MCGACGYWEEEVEEEADRPSSYLFSSSQTLPLTLKPPNYWCESSHFILGMLLPRKPSCEDRQIIGD